MLGLEVVLLLESEVLLHEEGLELVELGELVLRGHLEVVLLLPSGRQVECVY